jgi:hypothetical protein
MPLDGAEGPPPGTPTWVTVRQGAGCDCAPPDPLYDSGFEGDSVGLLLCCPYMVLR